METTANITGFDRFSPPELLGAVPESFLNVAKRQPERAALVADGRGELSYGELARRVRTVAGGLREMGVRPRDSVALLSLNRPEWAIGYLGIQAAGATVVPLDILLKPEEHRKLLNVSTPKALIVSEKFYGALKDILAESFPEVKIILMDSSSEAGVTELESLYGSEEYLCDSIEPTQAASLIFTSGTTGTPKVVILTHRNLLANMKGIFAGLNFNQSDRFLSLLPLSHVYECTTGFLTPLIAGATIYYARSLAAVQVVEDLRKHEITILIGVPLLFEKMVKGMKRGIEKAPTSKRVMFKTMYGFCRGAGKFGLVPGKKLFGALRAKAGMNTLRMMVSGGAPLDPAIADFYKILGFDFLQGYGMTECSPVISFNLPKSNRIGSVGPPLLGLDIQIENPNAEGIGEILVRGDSVTPGYLGDEEQTRNVIRDGWLCTGDLGKFKGGFLYICGRAKNLIVSAGGKNIYPEEIELALLEHDYIAEVLIVGRTTEGKQGERVCALVFPDVERIGELHAEHAGAALDGQPIKELVTVAVKETNLRMADYKRVVEWEVLTVEFEKTSSRKVKRGLYK